MSYPPVLFPRLFEQQVAQTPQAIALTCGSAQLTYAELDRRANQLAYYLLTVGVAVGGRVGLYLDRSLDLAIAILGILKAGAAYVPLDPKYPTARSAFILEETQVTWLLTQSHLLEFLPALGVAHALTPICLDKDGEDFAHQSTGPPEVELAADGLAYIIYTSGSTGKPKGVPMSHASIWHYLEGVNAVLKITAQDVYCHTASVAFSSSIRHLMLPLSQGARVVVATHDHLQDPLRLFQLLADERATVFDTVASVWRYGIQALSSPSLDDAWRGVLRRSSLQKLIFSGGLLPCDLLHRVRAQFDRAPQLFNLYGQTESLGVSAFAIPEDFGQHQGYVPIGYPYPFNQVFLLDEALQPVPVGEVGEICVVGPNLTRGYWQREDATAERFIPNPFSAENLPSETLFRSGDVARQLPDGRLEALGRTDFQVKIRGMRVELDEIATVLEQQPAIKEAAIAAYEDQSNEKRLVAYVVRDAEQVDLQTWRANLADRRFQSFLQDRLPDYMVPGVWIELDALPLTPNGKLNRLALPKPDVFDRPASVETHVDDHPISALRAAFCHAFNLEAVSANDTFILLGGHSLLYVQLSIEIEKFLGYLPARWENLTIAELEALPRQHQSTTSIESNVLLRAIAIFTVVGGHAKLFDLGGGAFFLLTIAGINIARFQSSAMMQGRWLQPTLALLQNLLLPYYLVALPYSLYKRELNWPVLLLFKNLVGLSAGGSTIFPTWFIQLLVQCIVLFALTFSLPIVRRWSSRSPWQFGIGALAAALALRASIPLVWNTDHLFNRVPHMMIWLVVLGWCIHFAQTRTQKGITSILIITAVFIVMGPAWILGDTQAWWVLVGGLVLLWQPYLIVPKLIKQPIQVIGAATYYIYLTHIVGIHITKNILHIGSPVIATIAGLGGGIMVWLCLQQVQRLLWQQGRSSEPIQSI